VTAHPATPTPVISPDSGSYPGFVQVTITNTLADATLYYTIDGSTPSPGNHAAIAYKGAFTLFGTASVKAAAFHVGYQPSAVAEQDYTITQGDIFNGDGTLTAAITSPGDGGQVTQPTTVSATITRTGASSSKSVAWSFYTRLSGAAAANDPWIPIGSGTIAGGSGVGTGCLKGVLHLSYFG